MNANSFLQALAHALKVAPNDIGSQAAIRQIRGLTSSQRRSLLRRVETGVLRYHRAIRRRGLLPSIATMVVSVLPESFEAFRRMSALRNPIPGELSFSMWCAMAGWVDRRKPTSVKRKIVAHARSVLISNPSLRGNTAWMVIDCLADHMPPRLARPVLQECAERSPSPEVRRMCVLAVSHLERGSGRRPAKYSGKVAKATSKRGSLSADALRPWYLPDLNA